MSQIAQVLVGEQSKNLVSPTTVTNSIRSRTRSPAHSRSSLYNKSPQSTERVGPPSRLEEKLIASQRRRPLGEMGKFTDVNSHASQEKAAEIDFGPKLRPKIVGGLLNLNHNVLACAGHTKEFPKEYSQQYYTPLTLQHLGFCENPGAVVVSDFAVPASEANNRQESRSDNRGRDSEFRGEGNKFGSRSLSASRAEKKSPSRPSYHGISDDNNLAYASEVERRDSLSDGNTAFDRSKAGNGSQIRSSLSPANRSPKFSPFDNKDAELDVSPPKVPRTSSAKEFDPRRVDGNLMEAQMELLHLGQTQESAPQTEARLARALEDLKRQDKVILGWKHQLEKTQQRLEETFIELEKSKNDSQENLYAATQIRAQAVQERKKIKDMYENELQQRKKLEENVSKLQRDVSSLKVSLRNARNSSVVSVPAMTSRGAVDGTNSGQIISLKTEIVELRSQLAEAHAASIDDHSTFHSTSGEVDELRKMLRIAEDALGEFERRHQDSENEKKKLEESERILKDKINRIEFDAKEAQMKLEISLTAAIDEENEVRAELAKAKANVERLERERSRKRVHAAADVERLTKQLARTKDEVAKLKEQNESEDRGSNDQSDKLKVELQDLRQKFFDATQDFASKAMKMAAELKGLRREVMELKQQLELKTEEIASREKEITGLQSKSSDMDLITSSRQITDLQDEIKVRKENEVSLLAEISQYKSLLEQEKNNPTKAKALLEAQAGDESSDLEKLRSQVDELKLNEKKWAEHEELSSKLRKEVIVLEKKVEFLQRKTKGQETDEAKLKAAEDSLKNEVRNLKAKFAESESKCTEERFRAEEERRISKDNETRFIREIDELKQENEKCIEEKLQLRQELEDLRKQMATAIGGVYVKSTEPSLEKDGTEVPSKVTKLRSELALARARLAAARDQTAMFSLSPTRNPPTENTEKREDNTSEHAPEVWDRSSVGSGGSCWAAPGMPTLPETEESPPRVISSEADDSTNLGTEGPLRVDVNAGSLCDLEAESWAPPDKMTLTEPVDAPPPPDVSEVEDAPVHDLALGTEDPTSGSVDTESEDPKPGATNVSFWEKSLMKDASKFEGLKIDCGLTDNTDAPLSPRSTVSFTEKSLVDEDVGETFPESNFAFQTAERGRLGTGVEELRRQLKQSSERLAKANSRLNGLVELPELKNVNGFRGSAHSGINREAFTPFADEEKGGLSLDQVVPSETEDIEVQLVRYAYV